MEVFKTGKPEDKELLSLAHEIVLIWRTLGVILGLKNATLDVIDQDSSKVLNKSYDMLIKWRESLGSEATYKNLAVGLDHEIIGRHDLVEKYCHESGK